MTGIMFFKTNFLGKIMKGSLGHMAQFLNSILKILHNFEQIHTKSEHGLKTNIISDFSLFNFYLPMESYISFRSLFSLNMVAFLDLNR